MSETRVGCFMILMMSMLARMAFMLLEQQAECNAAPQPCREQVVGTTVSSPCDPRAHIEVVEGVAICRCPVEVP